MFTYFDVSNRGTLSLVDLRELLVQTGLSSLKVASIVHALDKDNDKMVEWTEFLAAALCLRVYQDKELLEAAFRTLDKDKNGDIEQDEFESLFAVASADERR